MGHFHSHPGPEVDAVEGYVLAMRRAQALEVGGFDRRFRFYRLADFAVLFYLRRHVPVERASFAAMPRPGWGLVWQKDWDALPGQARAGARVVDRSPPASVGRADTRLLLVGFPTGMES